MMWLGVYLNVIYGDKISMGPYLSVTDINIYHTRGIQHKREVGGVANYSQVKGWGVIGAYVGTCSLNIAH